MQKILNKLQTTYSFSEREISLIRYGIEAVLGEISKCLLMLAYFHILGYTLEFLVGLTILLLLRRNTGGLHMKHYWSCFLFTFVFMNIAILILPAFVTISKVEMCLILLLCIVITLQIGPVHAKFIKNPNELLIKKSKLQVSYILTIYLVITIFLPINKYLCIGFWVILLQTIQLIIAKNKEVKLYEN